MRDLDGRRLVSRVKGRQALEKSLRRLVIRAHRFGTYRAQTPADVIWTARLVDALRDVLDVRNDRSDIERPETAA